MYEMAGHWKKKTSALASTETPTFAVAKAEAFTALGIDRAGASLRSSPLNFPLPPPPKPNTTRLLHHLWPAVTTTSRERPYEISVRSFFLSFFLSFFGRVRLTE